MATSVFNGCQIMYLAHRPLLLKKSVFVNFLTLLPVFYFFISGVFLNHTTSRFLDGISSGRNLRTPAFVCVCLQSVFLVDEIFFPFSCSLVFQEK